MLGKIPLVKGFHVIFTKFHDCLLHIRPQGPYRLSQKYNRNACEPFCSSKRRFSWISRFCAYDTEKLSDGHSYFTF